MIVNIRALKNEVVLYDGPLLIDENGNTTPPAFILSVSTTSSDCLADFIAGADITDPDTWLLRDKFTDSNGTMLVDHTPDIGPNWLSKPYPPQLNIIGNQVCAVPDGASWGEMLGVSGLSILGDGFVQFKIGSTLPAGSDFRLILGTWQIEWHLSVGINSNEESLDLAALWMAGDVFRLELETPPGIHLGARQAYKQIFGRTIGPCNPTDRALFEGALFAMQNRTGTLFIVRTVNMTNGAYIDEVVSALIY